MPRSLQLKRNGKFLPVRRALLASPGVHACPVACRCRRERNELGFLAKMGAENNLRQEKKAFCSEEWNTTESVRQAAAQLRREGCPSTHHCSLQSALVQTLCVCELSAHGQMGDGRKGAGAGQGMSKAGLLSSCTCHVMSPLSCSSSAARSARTEPNKKQAMSAACLASEQTTADDAPRDDYEMMRRAMIPWTRTTAEQERLEGRQTGTTRGTRTWVVGGERGGRPEVAVPRVPPGRLVQLVHGVRGVRAHRVGLEAGAAGLDGAAVDAHLRARVVQVRLQLRVRGAGPRHAPPAAPGLRRAAPAPAPTPRRRGGGQPGVVGHAEVRVVQPERALRRGPGLEVLVVQREQVRLHRLPRHQRRAGAGPQVRHQVGHVRPGVLRRGAGLPGVAPGRPPRLRHHDVHVPVPGAHQRRLHGVQLRVEHVGVPDLGPAVHAPRVGLEQAEGQRVRPRVRLVREPRVRVDHERRAGPAEEPQDLLQLRSHVRVERARRRRVRLRHHAHGVHGGEPDPRGAAPRRRGGGAEVLHGREQRGAQGGVPGLQHLVADGHGGDGGRRDEGQHVGGQPPGRGRRVRGQRRDVAVRHAHHHGDAGPRQRADQPRVHAVQPHLGDGRRPEQPRRLVRRRQVVRHLAVVDADVRLRSCTRAMWRKQIRSRIIITNILPPTQSRLSIN
uniref:Uncharacterized protein n=1 Tax=Zea mays TaxID=4577 RepID=A0A804P979_MAIZE